MISLATGSNTESFVDPVQGNDTNNGTAWACAFRTIAHAVSNGMDGAVVRLAPGTYTETNVEVKDKSLSIVGVNSATTILDAAKAGRHFDVVANLAPASLRLVSLTLKNGQAGPVVNKTSRYGGGSVRLAGASLIAESCVWEGNVAMDTR